MSEKPTNLLFRKEDKARPNCAVVGVYNHPQASIMTYYALHALQHRGQEASGITSMYYDAEKSKMKYASIKDEGLVLDVFKPQDLTDKLKGFSAVGHNRYSTTGASNKNNIQPFNMIYKNGILSLAHNGNLTNTKYLRNKLQNEGAIFQTTTDSEIIMHLVARSKETTPLEQVIDALRTARGAYSLVIQTDNCMIAARDPYGVRPLSIGRIKTDDGWAYMVASESAAFDIVSAEYIRSIEHNELIVIDKDTIATGEFKSFKIAEETPEAKHCIFEYIYFSRPDSKIYNHSVDKVRRKLGKLLAVEGPVKGKNNEKIRAVPVPDSANTATLGYARVNDKLVSPTSYELGLIRSHYIGRTFIAPGQETREFRVKAKFNTVRGVLEDNIVVLVDDSVVRGTTSKALIKLMRDCNPRELHLRVSSPPIKFPCHYGMDFPSKEELIANHYETEEEIGTALGVDTIKYLSINKLLEAAPQEKGIGYCTACFTGNYPIEIEEDANKDSAED